ncbi:MAG: hypothetical protein WC107_07025 [Patescibacteria group bacterium]
MPGTEAQFIDEEKAGIPPAETTEAEKPQINTAELSHELARFGFAGGNNHPESEVYFLVNEWGKFNDGLSKDNNQILAGKSGAVQREFLQYYLPQEYAYAQKKYGEETKRIESQGYTGEQIDKFEIIIRKMEAAIAAYDQKVMELESKERELYRQSEEAREAAESHTEWRVMHDQWSAVYEDLKYLEDCRDGMANLIDETFPYYPRTTDWAKRWERQENDPLWFPYGDERGLFEYLKQRSSYQKAKGRIQILERVATVYNVKAEPSEEERGSIYPPELYEKNRETVDAFFENFGLQALRPSFLVAIANTRLKELSSKRSGIKYEIDYHSRTDLADDFAAVEAEMEEVRQEIILIQQDATSTSPDADLQGKEPTSVIHMSSSGKEHWNDCYICKFEGGADGLFKPHGGSESNFFDWIRDFYDHREYLAYFYDKILSANVVPRTFIRLIEQNVGSIQEFVKGASVSSEYAVERDPKGRNKIGMLDAVAAISDRTMMGPKAKNCLFTSANNKLHAIDNGFSFSEGRTSMDRRVIEPECREAIARLASTDNSEIALTTILRCLLHQGEAMSAMIRMLQLWKMSTTSMKEVEPVAIAS